jgi:hypothetical protein
MLTSYRSVLPPSLGSTAPKRPRPREATGSLRNLAGLFPACAEPGYERHPLDLAGEWGRPLPEQVEPPMILRNFEGSAFHVPGHSDIAARSGRIAAERYHRERMASTEASTAHTRHRDR